jgi:D-alanyl-D-alanine carboxypeptidase
MVVMSKRTKRKIKIFIRRLVFLIIVGLVIYFGYKLIFKKDEVKDITAPVITYKDRVEVIANGDNKNIMDGISAKDDVDGDVYVTVEGDYDLTRAGEYKLYYVAKDSSKNVTKKAFTLVVKENKNNNNSSNNNSSNNSNSKVEFTTSKGYKGYTEEGRTYINGLLIVNKTYSIPKDFNPVKLNGDAEYSANQMFAAAKEEKGYNMWVQSGFRSYGTQERLYNNYVARDGKKEADKYSARPGHSEHQTGLAFDIGSRNSRVFANSKEYEWMQENAHKYGFIYRFDKRYEDLTGFRNEAWHYRYVGNEIATYVYEHNNMSLEEYFVIFLDK